MSHSIFFNLLFENQDFSPRQMVKMVYDIIETEFEDQVNEDDIIDTYYMLSENERQEICNELGLTYPLDEMEEDDLMNILFSKYINSAINNHIPFKNALPKFCYKLIHKAIITRIIEEAKELQHEYKIDNKIYRRIDTDMDPEKLKQHIVQNGLGNCWAKKGGEWTQNYSDETGKYGYVFEAIADYNSIDWIKTLYVRFVIPEENEIRLYKNVPIKLLNIYYSPNTRYSKFKNMKKLDVSDLKSKQLSSGSKYIW